MTKAIHTPGPWQVGPVDDTTVTHLGADGIRYEVAAVDGDYNDPDTWPVMEANARLIAAAPDLLLALQALVDDVAGYAAWERPCLALDNAKAALAKAGAS